MSCNIIALPKHTLETTGLEVSDNGRFIIRILCSTLAIVCGTFDIQDVSKWSIWVVSSPLSIYTGWQRDPVSETSCMLNILQRTDSVQHSILIMNLQGLCSDAEHQWKLIYALVTTHLSTAHIITINDPGLKLIKHWTRVIIRDPLQFPYFNRGQT
jgi:hypothetical protein